MRPSTLLIAILLTLPVQLQAGSADCDAAVSIEAASQRAEAVFVGTARSVSPTSDDVTFDVDWLWKGDTIPAAVKVSVLGTEDLVGSAASRTFVAERKYLVFTANRSAPFVVDTCAPNQAFAADGSVIPPNLWEALGNSTPTLPEPAESASPVKQPPSWTAMGAAALGAVLALLLLRGLLRWRERRKTEGPKPFRMRRSDRAWLAEQESLESDKPTSAERELEKLRKIWAKKRKKQLKAAAVAAKAAEIHHASADT